ncbi:unnamed protein product [Psylliodes chrysocephalus]|uniref:Uncharacterized protein n=1 Tax=Psylliodes chrysocephalus TaxID=3402493 RepID=A0A9P0GNZ9_9CUCU|nr:unnamed protein product [Psylliodes chrysocephala]
MKTLNTIIYQSTKRNKTRHIERLNIKTQDFEDEAMEMEKKDYQKIKKQSNTIKMLNKEIFETQVRMLSHETELMTKNNKIKCLEQELKDLDSVGRNMVNAIKILEEENNQYQEELNKLRIEAAQARLPNICVLRKTIRRKSYEIQAAPVKTEFTFLEETSVFSIFRLCQHGFQSKYTQKTYGA